MSFGTDEFGVKGREPEGKRKRKMMQMSFRSGALESLIVMFSFMALFAEVSTNAAAAATPSLGRAASGAGATRPTSHWTQPQQYQQVLSSLRLKNYTTSSYYFADLLPFLYPDSTLFVPTNEAFVGMSLSPIPLTILLSYHVVTQQYSFEQIQALPLDTRLPTVLISTILVTRVAKDDFRVDNVRIVEGDVCTSNTTVLQFSCHGVEAIMNASEWGTATNSSILTLPPAPSVNPPAPAPAPSLGPLSPTVSAPPMMMGVPLPSDPPAISGNPPLSSPPAITVIPPPSDPPSIISTPPPTDPPPMMGIPPATKPPPRVPSLPGPNAFSPSMPPPIDSISQGDVSTSPDHRQGFCSSFVVVLFMQVTGAILKDLI